MLRRNNKCNNWVCFRKYAIYEQSGKLYWIITNTENLNIFFLKDTFYLVYRTCIQLELVYNYFEQEKDHFFSGSITHFFFHRQWIVLSIKSTSIFKAIKSLQIQASSKPISSMTLTVSSKTSLSKTEKICIIVCKSKR